MIKQLHDVFFQNFGMNCRHAVDAMAAYYRQMSHFDITIGRNRHRGNPVPFAGIKMPKILTETFVDLVDNFIDAGQQVLENIDRPFFQRLRHNGMVGVGNGVGGNLPGIIPTEAFVVHKDAHQFRHSQGRVGIVDMNGRLFGEVQNTAVVFLDIADDALESGRNKEILLFESQQPPLVVGIVGIKDLGNRFHRILILHSFHDSCPD